VVSVLFPFAGEALLGECCERVAELGHSGAGEFKASSELGLRQRKPIGGAEGIEDGISQRIAGHVRSLPLDLSFRNGKGWATRCSWGNLDVRSHGVLRSVGLGAMN